MNDVDCVNASHAQAVDALKRAGNIVRLVSLAGHPPPPPPPQKKGRGDGGLVVCRASWFVPAFYHIVCHQPINFFFALLQRVKRSKAPIENVQELELVKGFKGTTIIPHRGLLLHILPKNSKCMHMGFHIRIAFGRVS